MLRVRTALATADGGACGHRCACAAVSEAALAVSEAAASATLRLLTWNCNGAFRELKADAAFAYSPDVAIIQECSEQDARVAAEAYGYTAFWFGNTRLNASHAEDKPTLRRRAGRLTTGTRATRGLAVFCRAPWSADLIAEPDHRWIVPLRLRHAASGTASLFTLIAVWSWVARNDVTAYVDRVRLALASHAEWFDEGAVVLAGDLNSQGAWDRLTGDGHSKLVRTLARKGMVSVYHHRHAEAHGEEAHATFHLYRHDLRPAHLDYIFLPTEWLPGLRYFEIGGREWLRYSDHLPLFAEVAIEAGVERLSVQQD
jgi:hypothetical protein